jgi:tetraacyldisaccharide 4'-kinase
MIMPGKLLMRSASKLYGMAVALRHLLYDLGIFRSHAFSLPVICVGNITAGGTGKTPHVIYLAERLSSHVPVTVLSRGYLRKSHGFREVTNASLTADAGDEPVMMAQALPRARVFVDRNRVNGIREILRSFPDTGVVILDDGFQHRAVKAGMYILLTDWNRLMTRDSLLPLGMLRENIHAAGRASVVIVTKTPRAATEAAREEVRSELLAAGTPASIFFTTLAYGKPSNLYSDRTAVITRNTSVLLVTGIANPLPLKEYLEEKADNVTHLAFPDHHSYTSSDVRRITSAFGAITGPDKIIVTTSKDGVRLKEIANIADHVREALHYLPVSVQFIDNEEEFLTKVYSYAGKDHQDR